MKKINSFTRASSRILISTGVIISVSIPAQSALDVVADKRTSTGKILESIDAGPVPGISTRPLEDFIQLAFSDSATGSVTGALRAGVNECRGVGGAYKASCTAAAYKRAARAANRPDYRDAKKELNRVARELDKLVKQNADKQAPKEKSYKAVKQEAVAKVNAKAVQIIAEAETKLIRSSGSGLRKTHYKRIAQAVNSTKVIFRS